MNVKKLIGTIIGVTVFIILIAGATFAWLTMQATVNNANYTGVSKDFVINYSGGSAVGNLNQVGNSNALTSNITSESSASTVGDGWLAVTASKEASSAKAANFKIKLKINTNTIASNSLVYAVCHGNCPTNVSLATVSGTTAICGSGVDACGVIQGGYTTTAQDVEDVTLFTDTSTFNTDASVATQTYNVYFWLNVDTIGSTDMGANFNGYIYATATQGE